MVIGLSRVQFAIVLNKSDSCFNRMIPDQIGLHEVLLPINHNHYNFREKKTNAFFFCERVFNTNYTKLEKISLAETLSNVTNSSIWEKPQFGRVRGRCYGYFDKFCDWWTALSTLNMIGRS